MSLLATTAAWAVAAFLSGALPFSVWLGRLAGGNVRTVGDGNPGAFNAWRIGGWQLGVAAILLDFFKGAVPVALAHFWSRLPPWALVPVALAPVAGHAFSPFLRFRGGKALAATFGIWAGLTLGEAPLVLGALGATFLAVQANAAWAVLLGMLGLLAHLLLRGAAAPLLVVWAGNLLILAWKHRRELADPPRPRAWVARFARRP